MIRRAAGLVALIALAPPAAAQVSYQQSPAVLARFGEVDVAMTAPGLAPGRTAPASHEEMTAFLAGLQARHPGLALGSLGRSIEGRDIPVLVFTAEGVAEPAAVRALDRPIVWLVGQQHGNEPAGGEAMLAVAAALAEGELKALLDRVTVVVVPRANPDGAAADTRVAANGLDPNRDHLLLTLAETRAIHARMRDLPPDLVLDHHEFEVAGTWLRRFGGLQGTDAMLLSATHPEVPAAVQAFAGGAVLPAIEAALRVRGLSTFVYATPIGRTSERAVSVGGTAPGIARNLFGLTGALSFLVETRGIGIGMEGYQRRVATHYLAARAALELAAARGGEVRALVDEARAGLAREREPLVVGHAIANVKAVLPLVDPATGADKPVPAEMRDSRRASVTATRPRPAGYLLQPEAAAALEALRIHGARLCELASAEPLAAEAFRVKARAAPVSRESINPEQAVAVTLEARAVAPAPGAAFVPLDQPLAAVIAAALEPDSPGSHVGVGLVPVAESGEAPIYRLAAPPPGAACGP
jgi:hypothetical protein